MFLPFKKKKIIQIYEIYEAGELFPQNLKNFIDSGPLNISFSTLCITSIS